MRIDMTKQVAGKWISYLLFLLLSVAFLLLSDESRTPITINGKNMQKQAGDVDNDAVIITGDSGFSGTMLTSPGYLLDKGGYRIGVSYQTDSSQEALVIYDNGTPVSVHYLNPSLTYEEFSFTLEHTSLDFQFAFVYSGSGSLRIQSAALIPEEQFYHDTVFLIVVLFIVFTAFCVWRYQFHRKAPNPREGYLVLFLIGIGLLASLPYLNTGLKWAIDLCYHLIRIEGIKDGLLAGQFPVVIYPEALHGNGYLNCMYPNLFLYFPALLRMVGVSMADSFKCLIIVFNLATAALTYHCVRTMGGSRSASLLASLLYCCCPYRFTNIYARGAVGEFLAMTFFPLLFAGLYHILIGNRKKWPYLALGMTGLLQTHILSVTLAGIFCTVFCILYCKALFMEKRILELAKAALLSLLLNIGFLVPFLDFYKNGNLWMDALGMATYQECSLNLSGLLGLQTTGDYHVLTLGIPLAVCAVISLGYLLLEQKKKEEDCFIGYLFLLGVFLTFMMSGHFPGWHMMKLQSLHLLLSNIQFAWRLLGPVSLLFAISGSICCFRSRFFKNWQRPLFVALILLSFLSVSRFQDEDFAYYSDRDYTVGHESKIIGIPKGDNTVVYPYEWRPKNTTDGGISTDITLSDESQVTLTGNERHGLTTSFQYTCKTEGQYIEIPVIYYNGYEATDENNQPVTIKAGYNNRIRVLLNGDGYAHTITVQYRVPLFYTLTAWISILTAVIFVIYRRYPYLTKKKGIQSC